MHRTWQFKDLEFVVLWEQMREDILPRPFIFTTDIPYEEEYQRERRRIRESLQSTADPALATVLEDVARPDIHVIVRGFDTGNPLDPERSIRLLAVRREYRGYLLIQLPGRTVEHSGGFTVTECDPLRLADMVAAALPETAAGKQARIVLPSAHEEVHDQNYGGPALWEAFEDTGRAQGDRFLRTQPACAGGIEISQGISRFGPRGRVIRYLEWRDLSDDGRYVITFDEPITAHAADTTCLTGMINAEIATIVNSIKDEHM
ncbi:ESX secretion-associated protein EspG [Nocardia beijingensis]|uniref:ESX secretion-associated protein EspG n=1 Tax=Nocardia beijingensis TaxID=95162 RepID=UPI00332573AE